jgi:hypothetical protein
MIGVALIAIASLATEIGASIGKFTIGTSEKRMYPVGVAVNLGGGLLIAACGLLLPAYLFGIPLPTGLYFSLASLPFFIPRLALDIIQAHYTLLAIARTERSTFGFLRTLTLPLLLIVDLVLGYVISLSQIFGICSIVVGLLFLFLAHGIKKKGTLLTLFTALNAVATISLYKYNITHFNSVAAEQSIIALSLVVYFAVMAIATGQHPFGLLARPRYFFQFLLGSVETVAASFAYAFAPAATITAARRALSVVWAIGSGDLYFHEKHILVKLGAFAFVATGIVLLMY